MKTKLRSPFDKIVRKLNKNWDSARPPKNKSDSHYVLIGYRHGMCEAIEIVNHYALKKSKKK